MSDIFFLPYFGNIEFYSRLKKSENVIFEVWDTYPKQTFRNRTQILGANGILDLSIPVKKPNGSRSKTHEILIDYREDWQKNHLKSIESAYKNSPYYEFYEPYISQLILSNHELLIEKNQKILDFLLEMLGIKLDIKLSHTFIKENVDHDFRTSISPKIKSEFQCERYIQVFADRFDFQNNLSILDLLFNEGPNSASFL
ncbi:MAG: WbqC family protein [Crocinitomicaceae bacterium]|nr:WbqC family protein [Crocinitomicaceae bacterium]